MMMKELVGMIVLLVMAGGLGYAWCAYLNRKEREDVERVAGQLQGYQALLGGVEYEDGSFESKVETMDGRVTNVLVRNMPFGSLEEALAGGYMEPKTRKFLTSLIDELDTVEAFKEEKVEQVAATAEVQTSVEKHQERKNIEVIDGGVTHGKITVYRPCMVRIPGTKSFGIRIQQDEKTNYLYISNVYYHAEDIADTRRLEYDMTNVEHGKSFNETFMQKHYKRFEREMQEIIAISNDIERFNRLIDDEMIDASDLYNIVLLPPKVSLIEKEEEVVEEAVEDIELPAEPEKEVLVFEEADTIQH